ncbi:MAG: TetR/AcrR family transcriptional regulator [Spirochaetaceae bacterium]
MGIAERRTRERDHRRSAILDAARRQFLAQGLEQVRMSQIADEAELSKGTIYLYFRDKTHLMYALLLEFLEDLRDRVVPVIDGSGRAVDKVAELVERYVAFHRDRREFFPLFHYLDYAFNADGPTDATAEACFAVIDELTGHVQQLLREGIADGSFRDDIDPNAYAVMYAHVIHSFMEHAVSREGFMRARTGYEPEELMRRMFRMILDSLQPQRK